VALHYIQSGTKLGQGSELFSDNSTSRDTSQFSRDSLSKFVTVSVKLGRVVTEEEEEEEEEEEGLFSQT